MTTTLRQGRPTVRPLRIYNIALFDTCAVSLPACITPDVSYHAEDFGMATYMRTLHHVSNLADSVCVSLAPKFMATNPEHCTPRYWQHLMQFSISHLGRMWLLQKGRSQIINA